MYIMNYYFSLQIGEKKLPCNMHKLFASLINPSLQIHVPLLLFDPEGWQISFCPHSCLSSPTSQTFLTESLESSRVGSKSNHDWDFLGRTRTIFVCLVLSLFATSVLVGVVGKQYLSSVQNV